MSTILVGSAPDSWGVWFPDDPNQTPYTRFLDEVAAAGYRWIELGPFGVTANAVPPIGRRTDSAASLRSIGRVAGT